MRGLRAAKAVRAVAAGSGGAGAEKRSTVAHAMASRDPRGWINFNDVNDNMEKPSRGDR